jgi:4-hydroxy-tetrahydrodipicolinate synthase
MTHPLAERLHGIIPPVITPLTEEGTFDPVSAERIYEHHLEAGVHGLFLFGSSGEGPLLRDFDRVEALDVAVRTVESKIPVLVGTMEPGTDQVIAQGLRVQEQGADALVVCPPFYFPPTQKEILTHFRKIHEAIDLPILVYDIPYTAKVKVELETMLTLAEEGTVIGAKDSSGDSVSFRRLLVKRPAGFKLFTGSELLIDSVLLQGADGTVPGLANVAPELFVQLYDQWQDGCTEQAVETQERIVRLFDMFIPPEGAFQAGYFLGAMKTAMKHRGIIATNRTCDPFTQFTVEDEERIHSIMSELDVLQVS